MFISKLHLHGFKSFLNKTDIDFGEGVTAVVGPNGCGKSNIVDAIRWVLGEQKISLLRSTKMEDIIFNGTKNHQPLSFCAASMLINNNLGVLPIEYNDVEISRRLYRSGESEFYINKTLCRLKDIQNLFVNTGMSSNAYSVIELKMVDTILSNNATDRRQMFEEAASINHYKQQRHAALRKMKATQLDMERVNDVIIEIKNTVNNLGLQMKRYKRHSKLTGELKELEIKTANGEIQLIHEKLAPIEKKLDEIKGHHSSLSGQMNLDDTLMDKVQKRFQKQKSKFNTCQIDQTKLGNNITELSSKRLVWSEKISGNANQQLHFKDEFDHCGENIALTKTKIVELNMLIKQLSPNVIIIKKKFEKTESNYFKISKEYDELLIYQQEMNKQSESKFLKICAEEAAVDRFIATMSEKEVYLGILMEKAEKNHIEQNHSQAEMNILQVKVDKYTKERTNIISELEKHKTLHSKAEDNVMNMKNVLTKQHARMNTIKAQMQFYENMITTNEGQPEGVTAILLDQKKYPYVLGVLANLIQVKTPYQAAVESVLGEFSNYLVVDTWNNASKLIQSTNHCLSIIVLDSIGRVTENKLKCPTKNLLSVINCNKQLNPLLNILIGNVCILPKRQVQPQLGKCDEFDWVSEGGYYFQRGYIFRSYGKGLPSIIGPPQKLEKLTKDSQDLGKEIKKMETEINNYIDKADSMGKKLKRKAYKLDLIMNKLNKSEQQYTRQDYILIQQQESMREIQEEIKQTETQIIAINISSHSARENVDTFRKEFDEFSCIQDSFKKNLETLRSKSNILQQDVQDGRISLMEIENKKKGLEDRIQTFSAQNNELSQRMQKYKLDLRSLKQENAEIEACIEEAKNKLTELNHSLKLTSLEKDKLGSDYNKTYVELQRLQSAIRDRQKLKDEYLDSIRGYELQVADGENDIKRHRQRIFNLYHENLQEIVLKQNEIDLSSNKLQIGKMRDSLELIGPVNMAATEEYEQESERYDFLTQQFEDLKESEKILKATIDNLDGEAQSKFMETFNAIQNNFTKTYSSFFDGGEGHLRLVGKDDPLEAEIEIIAHPPGKKTQTIRMLSAGEKALTAIALLFAIYLVKPSPFCILDEVDAPLDDINIGKFARALKDFSNKTQFIVVTHNKLTMEKADYMYGITQHEEGVSKIVSVKLNEARMEEPIKN